MKENGVYILNKFEVGQFYAKNHNLNYGANNPHKLYIYIYTLEI